MDKDLEKKKALSQSVPLVRRYDAPTKGDRSCVLFGTFLLLEDLTSLEELRFRRKSP
jgi:hypothetical protein